MTGTELQQTLSLKLLAGEAGMTRPATGCYIGDLLSMVMGRAPANAVWITVMGHLNVIAVAQLLELSYIVLCEGSALDEDARERADALGVPVLQSERPAYELAVALSSHLNPQ